MNAQYLQNIIENKTQIHHLICSTVTTTTTTQDSLFSFWPYHIRKTIDSVNIKIGTIITFAH